MSDGCLGLLLGLLRVGAGPVSNTLTSFCKFVPNAVLPCPNLIQGEGLSPPSVCFAMFCWHQWKTCTFLNRSGGRVDWGRGQRGGERRKGEAGRERKLLLE